MVALFTRLLHDDGTIIDYSEEKFEVSVESKINPVHAEDCKRHNMELLNRSNNKSYGYYRMQCGHTAFLHYGTVRKAKSSNFKCKECLDIKLEKEANEIGLIYHKDVRVTSINDSRYYTFPCGHNRVVKTANVRFKQVSCIDCKEEQFKKEAEERGLVMLSFESEGATRLYKLPCGHHKRINLTSVRENSYKCRICQEDRYEAEARDRGIEMLRDVKSSHHDYRVYRMQCGCVKEIVISCVRNGNFECKNHPDRSIDFTKPISVYLLKFTLPTGNVLKLGFAMDVKSRCGRYYLNGSIEHLVERVFNNGQDAVDLEKMLHRKYKEYALDKNEMSQYMLNGFTECYPMELQDDIISDIMKGFE